MGWTNPATAVVGDFITAAFWNTSGRDNLNYLFGTQNALVAATIQIKQNADGLGRGLVVYSATTGHYANVWCDSVGTAVMTNDAGQEIFVTAAGDVVIPAATLKRTDGTKIFPNEYHFSTSVAINANVAYAGQIQVTGLTSGGTYRVSAGGLYAKHTGGSGITGGYVLTYGSTGTIGTVLAQMDPQNPIAASSLGADVITNAGGTSGWYLPSYVWEGVINATTVEWGLSFSPVDSWTTVATNNAFLLAERTG